MQKISAQLPLFLTGIQAFVWQEVAWLYGSSQCANLARLIWVEKETPFITVALRTGNIRQIDKQLWIELFSETPQDILYTLRVLNRARATRAEPTRSNNARDLKKYARNDQSPIMARPDAWQAMEKHILMKKERYERVRIWKHKQRLESVRHRFVA